MMQNFRHRGLKRLFERGITRNLPPQQVPKLKRILHQLEAATTIKDMDLPGWGLHKLSGDLKDHHAVWVTGNFRVWFVFEEGNAFDVDYGDYH